MARSIDENIVLKLLELVPNENTSMHQLICKSSLDRRTIMKYLQLMVKIQNSPRLKFEIVGLRVFVKKEE